MNKPLQHIFLGLLCLFGSNLIAQQKVADHPTTRSGEPAPVVIYGEIRGDIGSGEVEATLWSNILDISSNIPSATRQASPLKPGHLFSGNIGLMTFRFSLPMEGDAAYVSLQAGKSSILDMYVVAPGDSVWIHMDLYKGETIFLGPSADSFTVQADIQKKLLKERLIQNPTMLTSDRSRFLSDEKTLTFYDSLLNNHQKGWTKHLEFLDSDRSILEYSTRIIRQKTDLSKFFEVLHAFKDKIDPKVYNILQADIIGKSEIGRLDFLNRNLKLTEEYSSLFAEILSQKPNSDQFQENVPPQAHYYTEYLYFLANIQAKFDGTSTAAVLGGYPDDLKEVILAKSIAKNFRWIPDLRNTLSSILYDVRSEWVVRELNDLLVRQSEGSKIVDFGFEEVDGSIFSSSSLEGKVVILDFWLTGCNACAGFHQNRLLPIYEHFKDREDFLIVSVGVDKERSNWIKGMESGKFTDPRFQNLFVKGYDHPFLDYYKVGSFPTYMIIGKDGSILKAGDFPKDLQGWVETIAGYLES